MVFFNKSLAGPGYVILNIIRVCNIISLLAVIAASSVMLVKTFVVSKFFFFDACSHVIAAVISSMPRTISWIFLKTNRLTAFLIVSEISIFRGYFARNWPLFGPESGFITLGSSMLMLGNGVLGNLNKQATSQKSLGLAFWRIVISAGIVVIVMGVVNLFVVRARL